MTETAQESSHHESPEEFKKHLSRYYVVFVALLCLTGITVGVSYHAGGEGSLRISVTDTGREM